MGFQHNIAFIVVTTIVILKLSTIVAATGRVSGPCKLTDYPEICASHVKGLDITSAVQQMIQATIDQTIQAKGMLNGIRTTQALVSNNLQDCKISYDDAIFDLKRSLANLKAKSVADLKNNLSAVVSYYMTCDNGFSENPGGVDPVAKVNKFLSQLASNNLALASGLKV